MEKGWNSGDLPLCVCESFSTAISLKNLNLNDRYVKTMEIID